MKPERCAATNRDGSPCSAHVWSGGHCRWHAPELKEQRREWSRKGGRQRSNRARAKRALPEGLMSPDELRGLLGSVLKGVLVGRWLPRRRDRG